MRAMACSIFLSSLRSRSRVRSSSACSSSMVARSAGSGTTTVSSRRCSVVSPALASMSALSSCSLRRKKASCTSFMYSPSGMASTSASVSWSKGTDFQLLARLGSFWRGMVTEGVITRSLIGVKVALAASGACVGTAATGATAKAAAFAAALADTRGTTGAAGGVTVAFFAILSGLGAGVEETAGLDAFAGEEAGLDEGLTGLTAFLSGTAVTVSEALVAFLDPAATGAAFFAGTSLAAAFNGLATVFFTTAGRATSGLRAAAVAVLSLAAGRVADDLAVAALVAGCRVVAGLVAVTFTTGLLSDPEDDRTSGRAWPDPSGSLPTPVVGRADAVVVIPALVTGVFGAPALPDRLALPAGSGRDCNDARSFGAFAGDEGNPRRWRSETNSTSDPLIVHGRPVPLPAQTSDCASPCSRMSRGRSMPMNTILLTRGSPSAHWGPRSLPIS